MLKPAETLKKFKFFEKKLQKFQVFGKNCKSFKYLEQTARFSVEFFHVLKLFLLSV